jgi:hypothetical protein
MSASRITRMHRRWPIGFGTSLGGQRQSTIYAQGQPDEIITRAAMRSRFPKKLEREAGVRQKSPEQIGNLSPDDARPFRPNRTPPMDEICTQDTLGRFFGCRRCQRFDGMAKTYDGCRCAPTSV